MLKRLCVKNFALISSLDLEFCDKLNVLSGETGAGKSIIVDCIMLLRGGRYDKSMLRYGETSGFVEGVFSLDGETKEAFADYLDEEDDDLVVLRKFNADGKNEIRINGKNATVSMLKMLMLPVVDICGQNEHQILANVSNHIQIVDYYAKASTENLLEKIATDYSRLRELNDKLEDIGDARTRAMNVDIYKYQLNEIESAKLVEGEEEELLLKRKRFLSAEKICTALATVSTVLLDNDDSAPAIDLLNDAQRELNKLSPFGSDYEEWSERLNSAIIEISDIAESVSESLSSFEFSQADLDAVEKRLDVIRNITSKYGKYSAVMAFKDELVRKIDEIENADEYYNKLVAEKKQVISSLYELSCQLSSERKAAAKSLEKSVMSELNELGMERSIFEVKFSTLPEIDDCEAKLSSKGMDEVEFYLCPNEGQPLLPLVKIISGGELSRLMLALKVVSSGIDETATVIFDEIDTGISGKVGQEIAKKLARLSRNKQLLCVTHLPQIASMADEHFFIDKKSLDGKTITVVKTLTDDEKIDEIARLSGAKDISEGANENARQMKVWSNEYKTQL